MKIGLVVDCGCDLPYSYLRQHHITVLPGTVRFKGYDFKDDRSEDAALAAYRTGFDNLARDKAASVTEDQIHEVFLSRLITEYDFVFCLTTGSARAPVYTNAINAATRVLREYRPIRERGGNITPFALRVIDSRSMGGGYAVLCAETMNRIQKGEQPTTIRSHIESLIPYTYTYYLIRDFAAVRRRLKETGEESIGWLQHKVVQVLDMKPVMLSHDNQSSGVTAIRGFDKAARRCFEFIGRRIEEGLKLPIVSIAYAGELSELNALEGYSELLRVARNRNVTVYSSMMCISAAAYASPGSLSFGFCAPPHRFD
jgi:fatty acid-binding protein DegV